MRCRLCEYRLPRDMENPDQLCPICRDRIERDESVDRSIEQTMIALQIKRRDISDTIDSLRDHLAERRAKGIR